MPSGFEDSNGNDLDNILANADLTKNINSNFETEGATGTGRYATRPTGATGGEVTKSGFITSGDEDLVDIFVKQGELLTYNYVLRGGSTSSWGAKITGTITAPFGTTLVVGIAGGGSGNHISDGDSYHGESGGNYAGLFFRDINNNDTPFIIAGGAGGTSGIISGLAGGVGGNAGATSGYNSGSYKIFNGSNGGDGTKGGYLVDYPGRGGGGGTSVEGNGGGDGKSRRFKGGVASSHYSQWGNNGNGIFGGSDGGGGGGGGYKGGGSGGGGRELNGNQEYNDYTGGGGGGGSSAYISSLIYQNYTFTTPSISHHREGSAAVTINGDAYGNGNIFTF